MIVVAQMQAVVSVALGGVLMAQQASERFAGERVIVTTGPMGGTGLTSPDRVSAAGPAKVCLDPSGLCFTALQGDAVFGLEPEAKEVSFTPDRQLLLFTAVSSASGGGSRRMIALLDLRGNRLVNLAPDVAISEQGEFRLWNEAAISPAPLLVVADYIQAPSETHFSPHRFRIRVYMLAGSAATGRYVQQDEYTTVTTYPSLDEVNTIDVLIHERSPIVARLRRAR